MEKPACTGRKPAWLVPPGCRGVQTTSIRLADSRLRYGLPHYQAHHATGRCAGHRELLASAGEPPHLPSGYRHYGEFWKLTLGKHSFFFIFFYRQ